MNIGVWLIQPIALTADLSLDRSEVAPVAGDQQCDVTKSQVAVRDDVSGESELRTGESAPFLQGFSAPCDADVHLQSSERVRRPKFTGPWEPRSFPGTPSGCRTRGTERPRPADPEPVPG